MAHCQLQFANNGAKKTLFVIGLVVSVIILEIDKVLRFAEDNQTIHNQHIKNRGSMFGTNKNEILFHIANLNFQILV